MTNSLQQFGNCRDVLVFSCEVSARISLPGTCLEIADSTSTLTRSALIKKSTRVAIVRRRRVRGDLIEHPLLVVAGCAHQSYIVSNHLLIWIARINILGACCSNVVWVSNSIYGIYTVLCFNCWLQKQFRLLILFLVHRNSREIIG